MNRKLPLQSGATLDNRYRVKHPIGEGGFSIVYAAERIRGPASEVLVVKELYDADRCARSDDRLNLRPLPGQAPFHDRQKQRCREEWAALRDFRHPNLVEILDFFETNGTCYMVMPFVSGESLFDRASRQPLSLDEVLRLAKCLADALDALHLRQIIHRDVKPENIWLRHDNQEPLLLDTGAARSLEMSRQRGATGVLTPLGAPELRGPLEQKIYGQVGPATDVFALAGTCAFALTGREPPDAAQRAAGPAGTDSLQDWALPAPPHVVDAIRRGLNLRIIDRPQSPGAFFRLLTTPTVPRHPGPGDPVMRRRDNPAPPKPAPPPTRRRRHSPIEWLAAVAVNLLVLALLWLGLDDAVLAAALFVPMSLVSFLLCRQHRQRRAEPLRPIDAIPLVNLLQIAGRRS